MNKTPTYHAHWMAMDASQLAEALLTGNDILARGWIKGIRDRLDTIEAALASAEQEEAAA